MHLFKVTFEQQGLERLGCLCVMCITLSRTISASWHDALLFTFMRFPCNSNTDIPTCLLVSGLAIHWLHVQGAFAWYVMMVWSGVCREAAQHSGSPPPAHPAPHLQVRWCMPHCWLAPRLLLFLLDMTALLIGC
jgi:hypothetical protein